MKYYSWRYVAFEPQCQRLLPLDAKRQSKTNNQKPTTNNHIYEQ